MEKLLNDNFIKKSFVDCLSEACGLKNENCGNSTDMFFKMLNCAIKNSKSI